MPDSVSSAAIELHAGRAPVKFVFWSSYCDSYGGGRLLASAGWTTGKRLMPLSFTTFLTESVAICSKYLRCTYLIEDERVSCPEVALGSTEAVRGKFTPNLTPVGAGKERP